MEATKSPVPTKFAHVVFRTSNIEAMKNWYCTVLGAHAVFENPMIAFLTFDDEHHRVAIINLPDLAPKPRHTVGLEHVAYTYGSLGELVDTYDRLKAAGITPYWCVNHGPTTSMYYRDPDGNQVELQVDNFPSVEELNGWFRSGEFAKNPIGTTYDPDKLVEKYRGGTPAEELVRQGAI